MSLMLTLLKPPRAYSNLLKVPTKDIGAAFAAANETTKNRPEFFFFFFFFFSVTNFFSSWVPFALFPFIRTVHFFEGGYFEQPEICL